MTLKRKKATILLVDDSSLTSSLMSSVLEERGYEVHVATDGERAIELARMVTPDLILLDVLMPVMDGFETCRRLKDQDTTRDIPVIFLSALNAPYDKVKGLELGAVDYVAKPVQTEELVSRVNTHLAIRRLQEDLVEANTRLEERVSARTAALTESNFMLQLEIEERTEVEESLRKINRAYKALSRCNQALIRTREEDAFLRQVCRIIKDDCGYPIVSVAFVEPNESQKVRPVAQQGCDEVQSGALNLICTGPMHTAIQTGVPVVSGNILEDARLEPWHNEAVRRGCASCASFPLHEEGKVIGALCILAKEPHAFYPEELALLQQMASDLAYGITSLRSQAQRAQFEKALRDSEDRFRTIFNSASDGFFLKDRNTRYTLVNPAMSRLLDMPPSSIVGKTDEDLFGADVGVYLRDVDSRVLDGETIEEEHTRSVNGTWLTFLETRVPVRNESGEVSGICGVLHNITDLKPHKTSPHVCEGEYPSKSMRSALASANSAAGTDSTVLLLGESGSGKDHLAERIHVWSRRSNSPFYAVNCAVLPNDLAESELFGYEPGAFTGARRRKRGLLELAEGGTLLLNEIGELSLPLQAKLLTFLDTRTFVRVGGNRNITVNARLIAATNRDLQQDLLDGHFRADLFYRLNVFSITVPPLRDRIADFPMLTREILTQLSAELQLTVVPEIDQSSMDQLTSYSWPGNVRELRNVLERELILGRGGPWDFSHLGQTQGTGQWTLRVAFPEGRSLNDMVRDVKCSLIEEALRRSGGRKYLAAQHLGISRFSLTRQMTRLGYSNT